MQKKVVSRADYIRLPRFFVPKYKNLFFLTQAGKNGFQFHIAKKDLNFFGGNPKLIKRKNILGWFSAFSVDKAVKLQPVKDVLTDKSRRAAIPSTVSPCL